MDQAQTSSQKRFPGFVDDIDLVVERGRFVEI